MKYLMILVAFLLGCEDRGRSCNYESPNTSTSGGVPLLLPDGIDPELQAKFEFLVDSDPPPAGWQVQLVDEFTPTDPTGEVVFGWADLLCDVIVVGHDSNASANDTMAWIEFVYHHEVAHSWHLWCPCWGHIGCDCQ